MAILSLRIAFGFRLIYGTLDNIISFERMREFEHFLDSMGFPLPLVAAIISVYVQFLAGLSWIVGWKVKLSSLLMILNFVVAIVGVHILHADTYLNTAPAIHLMVIAFFLYTNGPGKYALSAN